MDSILLAFFDVVWTDGCRKPPLQRPAFAIFDRFNFRRSILLAHSSHSKIRCVLQQS